VAQDLYFFLSTGHSSSQRTRDRPPHGAPRLAADRPLAVNVQGIYASAGGNAGLPRTESRAQSAPACDLQSEDFLRTCTALGASSRWRQPRDVSVRVQSPGRGACCLRASSAPPALGGNRGQALVHVSWSDRERVALYTTPAGGRSTSGSTLLRSRACPVAAGRCSAWTCRAPNTARTADYCVVRPGQQARLHNPSKRLARGEWRFGHGLSTT